MVLVTQIIVCVAIGYFVGCINPAYILGKIRGFDIRSTGSGNAGASNAVITMGKAAGLFCALFDIAKAYLIIQIMVRVYPFFKLAGILAGSGCIMGHIFPFTMHFHGGKGLATLGGTILAYDVKVFLVLLLCEFIIALIVDYICVVPMTAVILFSIIIAIKGPGIWGAVAFFPVVVAVIYRHVDNLKKIHQGIEAHFSYLWRKEAEIERIRENAEKVLTEAEMENILSHLR